MPRLLPETRATVCRSIEDAALGLFIAHGFAATTTRDIARATGLTAGALYSHYPSKGALFAAVVARYQARLRDEETVLSRTLDATRFPHDIPDLARAIRDLVRSHRAYWKLWYVDVIEFDGRHFSSALAPKALLERPALKARLEALEASDTLRIAPGVAFVMVYMHLFNYFLIETVFGGDRHYGLSEDDAIHAMADIFLKGMLA